MRRAIKPAFYLLLGLMLIYDGWHRADKRWWVVVAGVLSVGLAVKLSLPESAAPATRGLEQ